MAALREGGQGARLDEGVAQLKRRPRFHALFPRERPGALHAPGGVVRRPDPQGHSLGDQFAEGADGLLQRHGAVLRVGPEQIDVIDPEASQTLLHTGVHGARRETFGAFRRVRDERVVADLRRDPHRERAPGRARSHSPMTRSLAPATPLGSVQKE
ncbi:hypothetical protein SALBM135S_05847 [Streptomyces alboniger]